MNECSFMVCEYGKGYRKYVLSAGAVAKDAEGRLGTLLPYGDVNLVRAVKNTEFVGHNFAAPASKLDAFGHVTVKHAAKAIRNAMRLLNSTARAIIRDNSSLPSGKYLYRLNWNACLIAKDILEHSIRDCTVKVLDEWDLHSVEGARVNVTKWADVLISIETQNGRLECLGLPLADVVMTHCFLPENEAPLNGALRYPQYLFLGESGLLDTYSYDLRMLDWKNDDRGRVYAVRPNLTNEERKARRASAFMKQSRICRILNDDGISVVKHQRLDWVTVEEHMESTVSANDLTE